MDFISIGIITQKLAYYLIAIMRSMWSFYPLILPVIGGECMCCEMFCFNQISLLFAKGYQFLDTLLTCTCIIPDDMTNGL